MTTPQPNPAPLTITDYGRLYDQLLGDAVRALTAAARLEWKSQAGDGVGSSSGPCDWAEFVTRALAGTAANLDGIEAALAGRPGSWEAEGVRSLLLSTLGEDEQVLLEHRTEPVVVTINVDDIMLDLGVWRAYDEAGTELQRRYDALDNPGVNGLTGTGPDACLDRLTPATPLQEQQADAIADLEDRLEQQRRQDWANFGAALKTHVQSRGAATPGLRVPVLVLLDVGPVAEPGLGTWGIGAGLSLAEQLLDGAVSATPVPGDGRSPLERLPAGPASA